MRELLGKKAIKKWKAGDPPLIKLWMGISLDEAHRMKQSRIDWIENTYPLIDKHLTRLDCLQWLRANDYPDPPKSACTMCPYHSDDEWLRIKTDMPDDFKKAVEWELRMQASAKLTALDATPFCHHSLVPLDKVAFSPRTQYQNTNLFSDLIGDVAKEGLNVGCDEGMCGL
jgi:hypothetical protein